MAGLLLVLACAPDDCVAMCDAALDRYAVCMDERGLDWGMGYEDEADYRNWCETWVWEQARLGAPDRCAERTMRFQDGDCADYDAAW